MARRARARTARQRRRPDPRRPSEGVEREVGGGALPYGGRVADGWRVGRVLEERDQESPREDGAGQGDAALEFATCGQTRAEESVDDTEYSPHRHAEESRGEKEADLLGRAGEDLLVVGASRGLLQRYRPVEDGLPDEESEEASEEAGEQPGGHAAAQVGRDHGWP